MNGLEQNSENSLLVGSLIFVILSSVLTIFGVVGSGLLNIFMILTVSTGRISAGTLVIIVSFSSTSLNISKN